MTRRPPRSTRTDTLFPYTTLFRSPGLGAGLRRHLDVPRAAGDRAVPAARRSFQHRGRGRAHAGRVPVRDRRRGGWGVRSEEHTSELQSLMRISYAVFCLKKKKIYIQNITADCNYCCYDSNIT